MYTSCWANRFSILLTVALLTAGCGQDEVGSHPATVQLEGAWASAKLGSQSGLTVLSRYCTDPNYSLTACRYLEELGRDDLVPVKVNDPAFRARAEFANWLAHPNELGTPPDEVEIVDHRVLAWPPDGERKPLWLIKYRVKETTGLADDDVDCGLVGSITFCLFSYKLLQRPPDDAYAIHCYWEMEGQGLIEEIDAKFAEEDVAIPLEQWNGAALERPEVSHKAVLSPELRYPQPTVTLVSATLKGSPGLGSSPGHSDHGGP